MRPSSQSLRELQLRKSWADNCTLGVWDCKRRKTLSLQKTSVSVPLWPLLSKITSTTSSILTRSFTTYAWPSGKFALVGGPWWCVGCMWYFTSVYKKSRLKKNCKQYFHLRGVDYLKKKKFVQNCIQTEWKWIWLFFIVFQECKNSGGALSSGWISYSVSHMGSCVCLGSTCSEIEMENEQRQQATCYHFKYFLSTYPEFNFNK